MHVWCGPSERLCTCWSWTVLPTGGHLNCSQKDPRIKPRDSPTVSWAPADVFGLFCWRIHRVNNQKSLSHFVMHRQHLTQWTGDYTWSKCATVVSMGLGVKAKSAPEGRLLSKCQQLIQHWLNTSQRLALNVLTAYSHKQNWHNTQRSKGTHATKKTSAHLMTAADKHSSELLSWKHFSSRNMLCQLGWQRCRSQMLGLASRKRKHSETFDEALGD